MASNISVQYNGELLVAFLVIQSNDMDASLSAFSSSSLVVFTHGLIEQTRTPRVVSSYHTAVVHTRSIRYQLSLPGLTHR